MTNEYRRASPRTIKLSRYNGLISYSNKPSLRPRFGRFDHKDSQEAHKLSLFHPDRHLKKFSLVCLKNWKTDEFFANFRKISILYGIKTKYIKTLLWMQIISFLHHGFKNHLLSTYFDINDTENFPKIRWDKDTLKESPVPFYFILNTPKLTDHPNYCFI